MDFKDKLDRADDYLKRGDYFLAEEIYDEILARQEDNADALFGKGKCLFARCRYAEALESCDRAREIDPDAVFSFPRHGYSSAQKLFVILFL